METETAGAVIEAPAPFTLETAFKQASSAGEESASTTEKPVAPVAEQQDSTTEPTSEASQESEQAGQEAPPKSNRQAGREAYERGLKEGRELERKEAEKAAAQAKLLEQQQAPQRELEALQQRAEQGDLAASEQFFGLLRTQKVTAAAMQAGRQALLNQLGNDITASIASLEGADDDARDALMKAPSVADYGKEAFKHGRRIEKTVWEEEVAKRDATIEQLKGQLASRSPSPEPATGTRTNGSASFDGTWESAWRQARAALS